MGDDEIAGRTVAAAKDGGLVLSKGHRGRSRPDGTDMRQDAPTRIGSDTRPLVAGPTGVETLARLGSDPAGKPLQGPGGVFPEERILDDRKHGVNRHSPIVAMATETRHGRPRATACLTDGTFARSRTVDDLGALVRGPAERDEVRKVSPPGNRSMLNAGGIAHAEERGGFHFRHDDGRAGTGAIGDADALGAP